MKQLTILMVILSLTAGTLAFSEDFKQISIRHGMTENAVNEQYGPQIMDKTVFHVFPLPTKAALYKLDESTYMILSFFFGRVYKVSILDNTDMEQAGDVFKKYGD